MVKAAKLPPQGERSNTGAFPHLQYRSFPADETCKAINDATMVIVQFEIGGFPRQGRRDRRGRRRRHRAGRIERHAGRHGPRRAVRPSHASAKSTGPSSTPAASTASIAASAGWRAVPDLMAEYVRMGARYVSTGTDLAFLLGAATARAKQIKDIKL